MIRYKKHIAYSPKWNTRCTFSTKKEGCSATASPMAMMPRWEISISERIDKLPPKSDTEQDPFWMLPFGLTILQYLRLPS